MNIVVLAGGFSPERDVSLSSGCMIANALAKNGHAVILVDVFLGIEAPKEGLNSLFKKIPEYQEQHLDVPDTPPDLTALWNYRTPDTGCYFGENVLELCKLADVVFIALHGDAGENGQIQATFDLLNIRYTGSSFYGCMMAMDKNISKRLMKENDIPTAKWVHVADASQPDWEKIKELYFPIVVKPTRGGSSIGTFIVNNQAELRSAIEKAGEVDKDLIVEAFIKGREFDVGILNGKALMPIEIITATGFFDYAAKYQPGMSREVCPPENVSHELIDRLKQMSLRVHNALQLGFYSRSDFRVDDHGNILCLEANTLPGMTPGSLLPKEVAQAGIKYEELCEQIVMNAFKKFSISRS